MIDKNEIDVTDWIPQKDKWDIFITVDGMIDAHKDYDGNNPHYFKWFPKSYIRKYRTKLAKLIRSNNEYEIRIVYKKINKENK
jgi:hypothetical protein